MHEIEILKDLQNEITVYDGSSESLWAEIFSVGIGGFEKNDNVFLNDLFNTNITFLNNH